MTAAPALCQTCATQAGDPCCANFDCTGATGTFCDPVKNICTATTGLLGQQCQKSSDCSTSFSGLSCVNITNGVGQCDCDPKNLHAGLSCADGKVCGGGPPLSQAPGPAPTPGPAATSQWKKGGPTPGDGCDKMKMDSPQYQNTLSAARKANYNGQRPFLCQNGKGDAIDPDNVTEPTKCGVNSFSCVWSNPADKSQTFPPVTLQQ